MWVHSQKQQNDLCSFPRQTIQYHNNPNLCPSQESQRSWCQKVILRPTRPSRTDTQKRCPFHHRGLECKSRKSRDTRSKRQVWLWSTKWSKAKANRVLPREHTGHSTHSLPTTQEMTLHMDITRWSMLTSDWLHSLQSKKEKPCTISKNQTWSWLWFRSWALNCKIQI